MMSQLRQFLFRLRALFRRGSAEETLAQEIREHLAMMTEENIAAGMAPDEARLAALRQFGGVEQIKEAHRDERTFVWLEHLARDFKFAVRSLGKAPGFTAVTVFILALGVGVTTTLYCWIQPLVFDLMPGTTEPSRLVAVESFADSGHATGTPLTTSYHDFADFRDWLKLLDVTAATRGALAVGDDQSSERVWCELVAGNFFDVLGVKPAAGRFFSPSEKGDAQNAAPIAVISYRYWRSHYHSDPAAIGATLRINRVLFTIVGVAPESFHGTQTGLDYQIWLPLTMYGQVTHTGTWMLNDRNTRNFTMLARLKPAATIDQAQSELASLTRLMARRNPEDKGVGAVVLPLWRWHFGPQATLLRPMTILMVACLVLLLIVCANVANLQLARTTGRQKEFSIRLALGSSRGRLARLLLVESLMLTLVASVLGLLLAVWLRGALDWLLPAVAQPTIVLAPSAGHVLGFSLALVLLVATATGLTPAWHAARSNLSEMLNQGGRSGTVGAPAQRLRSLFVITEVALAVIALVGAAVFLKSFEALRAIAPGFVAKGQVLAQFNLTTGGYTQQQADSFCQRMTERLRQRPGVTGVSYADSVPLGFYGGNWEEVDVEGYHPTPGENMKTGRNMIGPGYFDVMKIPRLEGRDFDQGDSAQAPPVMIVSQEFVRRFISQGQVLGRKVRGWGRWFTIVGVVADIKLHQVSEGPLPFFYIPMRQQYRPEYGLTFHVRTEASAASTIAEIRRTAAAIDPALTMFDAQPMTEYIAGSLYGPKIAAIMLSVLGFVGVALAAMGLYSMMAYAVAQRTREIGIRVALGARPTDVLKMVLRQGMRLTGIGLVAGSIAAAGLVRIASNSSGTLHAADPTVYLGTAFFTMLVALVSVVVPAFRALRVSPIVALRSE